MFPKTIFSFLYRFCLEIETYYTGDGGDQENVFKLSDSEMRNRVVDLIDVVKDQVTFSRCFLLRHHNFSSFATFFFFRMALFTKMLTKRIRLFSYRKKPVEVRCPKTGSTNILKPVEGKLNPHQMEKPLCALTNYAKWNFDIGECKAK